MPSTFLTSDTHFGHVGVTRFTNDDGSPLRPWDNIEDMNEALIKNWNDTVGPKDLVYHLGDVVMNNRFLDQVMPRLNGRKKLVRGNHDFAKLDAYFAYFDDILGVVPLADCILSHIPLHPMCVERFKVNVHGHLHGNIVKKEDGSPDKRYISVCVELTDFTPVSYEDIRKEINVRFPS